MSHSTLEDVGKVSSILFPCSALIMRLQVNAERVKEGECDTLLQQFAMFLDSIPVFGSERFANFQSAEDRVDTLFFECMANESYKSLFSVVKLILICE